MLWRIGSTYSFPPTYQRAAPARVAHPPVEPSPAGNELRWERRSSGLERTDAPAVANVTRTRFGSATRIVITDMRRGAIPTIDPDGGRPREIARLLQPCCAVPDDLDRDGRTDLLVAELGTFFPSNARKGRVVWLRQTGHAAFQTIVLAKGLARVADVQPGDLDGGGDTDLLVTNGDTISHDVPQPYHGIDLLETRGELRFTRRRLARMYAAYRAVPADLDGDQDLDVLVIAFVHENDHRTVTRTERPLAGVIWLETTGDGRMARHVVKPTGARHPTGIAGDLDSDGGRDLATGRFVVSMDQAGNDASRGGSG